MSIGQIGVDGRHLDGGGAVSACAFEPKRNAQY